VVLQLNPHAQEGEQCHVVFLGLATLQAKAVGSGMHQAENPHPRDVLVVKGG